MLAAMPEGEEGYRSFCAVIERFCALKSSYEQRLLDYESKQRARWNMINAYFAALAKLCVFMRYGTMRAMELSARDGSVPEARRNVSQLQTLLSSRRFG